MQNTCWLGKTLSQQSKVNEDEDPLPLQVLDPCVYKSQQRDSSSPRDECRTQHKGTMPKNNNKKNPTPQKPKQNTMKKKHSLHSSSEAYLIQNAKHPGGSSGGWLPYHPCTRGK